jgi:non-specific serine/threonine protein kinase/serine/threonine-protein kinase
MPLSLDYAAPELLEGAAASTSSDIYGLAATLYALLTGGPPLNLSADPLPVALRRAVEELPPPLSQALSDQRRTSTVCDLQAILARALSKQPGHRYSSLEAFCGDLQMALEGRPVHARRHERGYIAARFVKRHVWQTAAVGAVILSMAGGLSASLWQAHQAGIERDWALREQARIEAVQQYLYFMLRDGADASGGTEASADEILDAAAEQVTEMFANAPEKGAPVMHTLGELYFYLNDYEAAAPMLERIVESDKVDPVVMASAQYDLAQVHVRAGLPEAAAPLLAAAQAFWNEEPGRWERKLADSRLVEARLLRSQGKVTEAVTLLRDSLPERIALSGETDRKLGVHYNNLGVLLIRAGQPDEAVLPLENALHIWKQIGLENSPDALNTLNNLATIEVIAGRYENAAPLFRELLDLRRMLYGGSTATAAVLNNYGKTLLHLERPEEALPLLEEAAAMARQHAGEASMAYASAVAGVAKALSRTGQFEDALETAKTGYVRVRAASDGSSPMTAVTAVALGREEANSGDPAKARELLDQAEIVFKAMGPGAQRQLETIDTIRSRLEPAHSGR